MSSKAGLKYAADIAEFRLSLTASKSNTGLAKGKYAAASFYSKYEPNLGTIGTMLELGISPVESNGSGPPPWDVTATTYRLESMLLSGGGPSAVVDSGFDSSPESLLQVSDLRIYIDQTLFWRVTWSEFEWFVNGVSKYTTGPQDIILTDLPFTPSNVPIFGDYLELDCSCAVGPATLDFSWGTLSAGSDFDAEISASASAGFRYKEIGAPAWTAMPVTPYSFTSDPISCAGIAVVPDSAGATNTNDLTASSHAHEIVTVSVRGPYNVDPECHAPAPYAGSPRTIMVTDTYKFRDYSNTGVAAIPDLSKSVKRWVPSDHAELVERCGTPGTTAGVSSTCYFYEGDNTASLEPTGYHSTTTDVHPTRSRDLANVTGSTSHIEDILENRSWAPIGIDADKFEIHDSLITVISPGSCGMVPPGNTYPPASDYIGQISAKRQITAKQFPANVEDESENFDITYKIGALLNHTTSPRIRYCNYIINPHWCLFVPFPPNDRDTDDDSILDAQNTWPVDDLPIDVNYWTKSKTQWTYFPYLSAPESTKRRTSLVSHPTNSNWFGGWFAGNVLPGVETYWWGINRFSVLSLDPDEFKVYTSASAPLWSPTNCTLGFGATITVTPTTTSPVIDMNLGSFTEELGLYPLIAREIELAWSGATITAVSVTLISASGDENEICTADGRYFLPSSVDSKYAGSWAQDFGTGYVIDTGSDTLGAGDSAGALGDAERVHSLELLHGCQGSTLRFKFTLSSTASTVSLSYPKMFCSSDSGTVVTNLAQHSALIWPRGQGARFGQWQFWNGSSIETTPIVLPPGWDPLSGYYTSSLLDALCWKHLFVDGISASTDLAADIALLFDSVEGNDEDRADTGTVGALVPGGDHGRLLLIDSLKCVPPVAIIASRSLDADMQPTGDFAQESWTYSCEPRRFCSRSAQIQVVKPDGSVITSSESAPLEWHLTSHRLQVANNEPAYTIRANGHDIAESRPWHGYFALSGFGEGGEGPYNIATWYGFYMRVWSVDGNVRFARAAGFRPPFEFQVDVTSSGHDSHPAILVDRHDRIHLVFDREAAGVMLTLSDDRGATWDTPALLMADRYFATCFADSFGRLIYAAFGYNSGSSGPGKIYLRIKDPGTGTTSSAFAITNGSSAIDFEPERFQLCESRNKSGAWILTAKASGATEPSEWQSFDLGQTWEAI